MNLRKKINEIKVLEDISDKDMYLINTLGVVTGSSAWGVDTKSSDIDIIIPLNSRISFGSIMESGKGVYLHADEENKTLHYVDSTTENLYVLKNEIIYNLIFTKTKEAFDEWVFATEKMKEKALSESLFKEKIKDRDYRIGRFKCYKAKYKEAVEGKK